jgi:sugar phosphate permease
MGWLVDRFGPRAVMRVGMVIFGLGLIYFSTIDSLFELYVAVFVMALGSSLGGFLPITTSVVNWFRRRRSTALAVSGAGFAVGGLLVPVTVLSIETLGWRETAFGSGVIVLTLGNLLVSIIRSRPEDYGLTVDGLPEVPAATRAAPESKFTAAQAMRTRAFWCIALGQSFSLLVTAAVLVHVLAHLNEDVGMSLGTASLIVTVMTGTQLVCQLAGGVIGDRFDKRAVAAVSMAMHTVAILILAYATALAPIVAFAVINGAAMGVRGPLLQALRADYFGRGSFGTIMGVSNAISMAGNIGGPMFAGLMADRTGDYTAGFTILALLSGVGALFFLLATPPVPPASEADGNGAGATVRATAT